MSTSVGRLKCMPYELISCLVIFDILVFFFSVMNRNKFRILYADVIKGSCLQWLPTENVSFSLKCRI
jgi:hypothetical protein